MYRFERVSLYIGNRFSVHKLLLVSVWILGLFLGCYFASRIPADTVSLMRSVTDDRLSIVAIILVLILPLFMSAILLRITMPVLIFPLVLIKAFCFSFCSYGLVIAFADAGWLVRWLLVFSDSCIVVLLLWFWFRNIAGDRRTLKADLAVCSIASALIVFFDYLIVSPFTQMLFH